MTLPGTYARFLAVTWGKPFFVVFQSCIGLAYLLGFFGFGVLSSHGFCRFLVTHPFLGFLLFFRHGFGLRQEVCNSCVGDGCKL